MKTSIYRKKKNVSSFVNMAPAHQKYSFVLNFILQFQKGMIYQYYDYVVREDLHIFRKTNKGLRILTGEKHPQRKL